MTLKNLDKVPDSAIPLLVEHTRMLSRVLSKCLVGVYLHGSAAMGGFTWEQSDIDYIALIAEPLSPVERKQLASAFLDMFGKDAPAKGVETSIVLKGFAGSDFRHPTPYEFHFGTKEQIRLHASPHETEMVDPDLAAHFTIIKHRGVCIYRTPINSVFSEVPHEAYLSSIIADSEESFRNIQSKTGDGTCIVPTYAVLNFCRVLAYMKEGLILSKVECADWGVSNVSAEFHSIILSAKKAYYGTEETGLACGKTLKRFAVYSRDTYLKYGETG